MLLVRRDPDTSGRFDGYAIGKFTGPTMIVSLPLISGQCRTGATPAPAPHDTPRLIDSHGRSIRDLRLSITDRCNFRCVYCLDPDTRFMPHDQVMTIDEIERVARICVSLGVEKIRLTGGEPTVRKDLDEIIARVSRVGAGDVALTTNGSRCDSASLRRWRDAGLSRITFSIDSLRPDRFAAMTRAKVSVETVVEAIEAASRVDFDGPVKVNAVVVRGWNDDEVADLAGLARRFGIEMRFIEFMPLDASRAWDESRLVPAAEVVERIHARYPLVAAGRVEASATSLDYAFADGTPGRVGMIAPVTRPFCGECSRLRITADAKVRPCLFSLDEWDLRPLLRGGAGDDEIARFMVDATWTKQRGHGIRGGDFRQPERTMSAIGG